MTQNLESLGPFRMTNLLGFNGVFATFKGFDQYTELPAAVVAVHVSQIADETGWERFEAEFRPLVNTGASRVCHPSHFGQDSDHYWAAYEWMKGSHLGIHVRDQGLPHPAQAFHWISETADAVATLHRNGILHRLINPASIFVNDFQQASLLHAAWGRMILATRDGLLNPAFGSILPFVAPEIAAGHDGDESADVYSLGSNLYFLLTGHPVYWHEDPKVLVEMIRSQPPDVASLDENLPPEASELVGELLAQDAGDRPVNLPALADRMRAIAAQIDAGYSLGPGMGTNEAITRERVMAPGELGGEGSVPDSREASRLADVVRQRHQDLRAAEQAAVRARQSEQAVSTPVVAKQKAKKPVPLKMAILAGGVALILTLIVAAAIVVLLNLNRGGEVVDAETPPSERTAGPSAEDIYRRYEETTRRLRVAGQWSKAHERTKGRWPLRAEEMMEVGAQENELVDGWERQFDVRGSFVISAGADGQWDTDDDRWIDAETGELGGHMPAAPRGGI